MKRSISMFLFLAVSSSVFAQAPSDVTITRHRHDRIAITTRDYWVALPQNYVDQSGKYVMLYISSANTTTAYVAYQGDTTAVPVVPGKPSIFNVPLSWEIQSSDVVENKAIHVWSNDAALFVDVNQHAPYTSDATYVIPSIGWGRSYVVASYESLFEGFGSYVYDMPSEFVILSDQDGTKIDITPSIDLRGDTGTTVAHPKGTMFQITLNAGQTVQYKATAATDADNFDVTGTTIRASKPIGVIGASECANIPVDFPYCDYVCEMLQPTRTWGTSYYTAPLVGRKGGDTYLVIGSKPGQTISRTDATGTSTFVTLKNPFDHYFRHDVATPGSWTSSDPFLLIQYSNSSTWPDGVNGSYDPFMMDINATNHFSTPVIFNVLGAGGNQSPYVWQASIVARSKMPVVFDGATITSTPIYDDHQYAIYQVANLKMKQYTVSSDSGVSVSVYGQSFDEAVGYSGTIGVSTVGSEDSLTPMAVAQAVNPTDTHIDVSDLAGGSGLSHFEVDKMVNMKIVQPASFVEGNGDANGSFDLVVTNPELPAHATVRVFNLAGNYTSVERDYLAGSAGVATEVSNATTVSTGSATPSIEYALSHDGRVNIGLFDITGNRVLSVLDGNETAGTHAVTPDVRLLPSGVYIYRIEADGQVHSGHLAITR